MRTGNPVGRPSPGSLSPARTPAVAAPGVSLPGRAGPIQAPSGLVPRSSMALLPRLCTVEAVILGGLPSGRQAAMSRDISGCHSWEMGEVLLASCGWSSGMLLNIQNTLRRAAPRQKELSSP